MHGNRRYLPPIDTATGNTPSESPHGTYTLTAGATYVYALPTRDTAFTSVQLTGDAAIIITSATVQDTNHPGMDVAEISLVAGEWASERPTTGYVPVDGTGWTVGSAATACVVAAAGTGVGGAMWHIAETGASRTRLLVVVGATGGKVRVSGAGK